MEQRLSILTLGVADVTASRRFYERLGWRAAPIGDVQVAFFQLGGIALALYASEDLAKDTGLLSSTEDSPSIALAHNVRHKEDVDAMLVEAEKAGAQIIKPAEDKFWGGCSGYFADPDGYPWEVAWNPGFELKEDGSIVLPE